MLIFFLLHLTLFSDDNSYLSLHPNLTPPQNFPAPPPAPFVTLESFNTPPTTSNPSSSEFVFVLVLAPVVNSYPANSVYIWCSSV